MAEATKSITIKIRVSEEFKSRLDQLCKATGLSQSDAIRQAVESATITPAAATVAAHDERATELRRIGALLKHLYPKADSAAGVQWTAEERARWWSTIDLLIETADGLTTGVRDAG